jgi:hypothetical protein
MPCRLTPLLLILFAALPRAAAAQPEVVELRKIWDSAPHNAFTDLIRYHDRWWCTFREASGHVTMDGAIRVLTSADGVVWEPAARLESAKEDLRDPKLSIAPTGELMLLAAGATHPPTPSRQSYTWFSSDGRRWSAPTPVGDHNYWLWRVAWRDGAGYGFGYEYTGVRDLRLYRTRDGRRFERETEPVQKEHWPNESSIVFLPDGQALCLLRRERGPATALLGESRPPYREWKWKDLGRRVGGPHIIRLPDGRLLAAVRLYDGRTRTSLCWLDRESGRLDEILTLPSSGDSSYPGLVWHEGLLWVSYYSSHEGKTSIYLAKVKLPPVVDTARNWKRLASGDGYSVEVGDPALVALAPAGESRWGYYQFPSASRLPDGRIRVTFSVEPDSISAHGRSAYPSLVSSDEGATWQAGAVHPLIDRGGGRVNPAGPGEFLYNFKEATFDTKAVTMPKPAGEFFSYRNIPYFRVAELPEALAGYYATVPALRWNPGSRTWSDERLRWDTRGLLADVADGGFADKASFEAPVLEGDNELLVPEYRVGYQRDDGSLPHGHDVLLMVSRDGGRSWERRSALRQRADENWTEPALAWNSRGELVCVFRRADHRTYLAMGMARSKDRGRTWSDVSDVFPIGVFPQLLRLGNGALALAFGRPGVYLSFSTDGTGDKWTRPVTVVGGEMFQSGGATCGYTSLVPLGPDTFLLFYSDFRFNAAGGTRKAILARPVRLKRTAAPASGAVERPIDIGSRRELLLDDYLIERFSRGAGLRLHSPVPREAVLVTDQPWEGSMGGYPTVVAENGRFRMYYRGWEMDLAKHNSLARPPTICLAESTDGIHWQRTPAGRFEYAGNRKNNIVWMGAGDDLWGMHGFAPFLDTNPASPADRRWKAVGGGWNHPSRGLYLLVSPDGKEWKLDPGKPMLAGYAHDSHNTVLWDAGEGCYRAYFRQFNERKIRGIMTATSPDLVHWSDAVPLQYPDAPEEQLYVNNVMPYYRAPHISVGFPARYVEREWSPAIEALPELEHRRLRARMSPRYGAAITDTEFMSSRDKVTFRRWAEAFVRPGLRAEGNWTYGDNYLAWGMLETDSALPGGGKEISLYAVEGYWRNQRTTIRRHTLRIDGFVSLQAALAGGEIVTRPFVYSGARLSLNISTSAGGGAQVELEDAAGAPIEGYALEDCHQIVGDTLDYTVRWKKGADLSPLAGKTIRMRIVLRDADLYSFRFEPR